MHDLMRQLIIKVERWYERACLYAHKLLTSPRLEYWMFNPNGQFVTICVVVAFISLAYAVKLGFLEDGKECWAWICGEHHKAERNIHASDDETEDMMEEGEEEQVDVSVEDADTPISFEEAPGPLPKTPQSFYNELSSPPSTFKTANAGNTFGPAIHSVEVEPNRFEPNRSAYRTDQLHFGATRTGQPSNPGYQTPSTAKRKSTLIKEGLFNSDATLTKDRNTTKRGAGLVETLVMDEGKRKELRRQALGRMKVEDEARDF